MQATLLLEDGTKIPGKAAGAPGIAVGELAVYTGHDSIHRLTDPATAGQICAFTQPSAGIWGVNTEHCETGVPWAKGIIARELAAVPSNWRSAETLDYYLRRNLVAAIEGIDVSALRRLAAEKQIKRCAVVSSADFTGWDALLSQIRTARYSNTFSAAVRAPVTHGSGRNAHFAVCDFGSSRGLTKLLNTLRIRVTLLPPYDAPTILQRGGYDALIIPNGAGAPRSHPGITDGIRDLIAAGVPILGYGLGFHFIAAALGVRFHLLREPHRGAWLPVADTRSGAVFYTWQMHSHTPAGELPDELETLYRNASDGTVEGFRVSGKPILAAHFLTCADMRLGGTGELLSEFLGMIKGEEA